MFNCFKKYLLIIIFLGVMPSIYAMEDNQKYRWPLNAITSLWSKMPSIPSKLLGWDIRKKAEAEKPKNTTISEEKKLDVQIPSGGLDKILKIANAKLIDIAENALKNGKFKKEDIENIKRFLIYADPNLKIGHQTLLHIAALLKNKELFNYLKDRGAKTDIRNKDGWTPLDIKKATNKLANTLSIFNNETEEKKHDKIMVCIDFGANPNFRINKNRTLLRRAIYDKQEDLVNHLLLHGANLNISDIPISSHKLDKVETKILGNLLHHITHNNTDEFLFECSLRNFFRNSLWQAVKNKDTNTVSLLIAYNADVNSYPGNYDADTLLERAISYNTAVKELYNAGAQIINTDHGRTAFHYMVSDTIRATPKETIEAILTCARPDKIQQDKEMAWIVRGIIWAFKYDNGKSDLSILPHDIKLCILSHLPEKYFQNSKGALYRAIFPTDYKERYFLEKTKERVTWLIEMSQKKNYQEKTASQLLFENNRLPKNYKNEVLALVDGTQIEDDYKKLIENPGAINQEKSNLARKIYDEISTQQWKDLGID